MKSKLLKIVSLIMAVLMIAASLAGCKSGYKDSASTSSAAFIEETAKPVNVAVLKGPTALGMLKLMSDDKNDFSFNDYSFEVFTAADQVVPELVKGNIDIAAVPTNLAATLYKKTEKGVSVIAVNTLGVLSIVTTGVEISSISDLKGKTIYATGKGATPEYALNYILEKNGLKVGEDVKIEYKSEHSELATAVIAGEVKIAMLPQPFVTNVMMQNDKVKIALDLSDEWAKISETDGGELVMGCIVVRKEFLKENEEAVKTFLNEYSHSTLYANEKPDKTGELSDEFAILPSQVVSRAIPSCNIVFIRGEDMKSKVSAYLKTLLDANPASIGGQLPDDEFYYVG
ncbi:MAG: MqnA/MqnD/SBP family protein [Oscillospiraceae bacterium]|nr:MqnA/MqnD/SBP family protein [Oscillospiraceae bacterium]